MEQNNKIRTKSKESIMQSQPNKPFQEQQAAAAGAPYHTFDYNQLVVPEATSLNRIEEEGSTNDQIYVCKFLGQFIDEPQRRVSCSECKKEISKTTTILSGHQFSCVGCFAKTQPKTEGFTLIKSLNYPVIELNWKANHEILFLSLLQKLGFGNWKEIKDQMQCCGAKYTEQQLESHYYSCYLSQQDYLPKFVNNESFFQKRCEQISISKVSVINNPTSISSLATATYREECNHQQFEEIDDYYATHNLVERQAKFIEYYNEKRNEFQMEYDHQAEILLANLEFRDDDCEEEKRIKYRIIDQYNKRLEKRNKIKEFVLEHRLLEDNYQKEMDKYRNEYEKEAFEELKPLARFTSLKEYNELVRKIAFTKQLKSTIQGLRRLRRSHPTSYKNLDEFLNTQPEESKPKKKNQNESMVKTGKKVEEVLEKQFKLNKKDFQNLFQNLQSNGKKGTYKNVEAVMLEKNY